MTRFVSFLRAINVGGHTVSMVELRALFESLGLQQVEAATAVNVGFVAGPLRAGARSALLDLKSDIDDFHVHGREVYWFCKKRQSESRFSNVVFERALKTKATWRGLNTVVKLAAKYPG